MIKILETIKELFTKFLESKIYTNKKYFIFFILAVLAAIYYLYNVLATTENKITYDLAKVERGDIVTMISGSGQIISETQIDTKGESGGQVSRVNVKAGDRVAKGQILAVFDQRSAATSLAQAQNSAVSAKASYDKFINGLTENEKKSFSSSVENSEKNLENAKQNLVDKIKLISVDLKNDLVSTNNLFANYNTIYPIWTGDGTFNSNNFLQNNLNSNRSFLNAEIVNFENEVNSLNVNNVEVFAKKASDFLDKNYTFYDDLHNIFANYTIADNSASTKITTYTNLGNNAKTKIRNNISSINTNLQNIENAKNSLEQSKITFNTKTESPREEDIKIQKANLNNAYISLQNAQNNFEKTIVRAPFSGTVAVVNAKVGEIGVSNIATLIADEKQAKIQVSESDVVKIKNGQKVNFTFDSIEGEKFEGIVDSTDVLGTVSSGVVTYNIYIKLNSKDIRIKPNMSVNSEIILNEVKNILKVDVNAVKGEEEKFVRIVRENILENLEDVELSQKPERIKIETGESNDEFTEIKSEEIKEGDLLVLRENGTATVQQKSIFNLFMPARQTGQNRTGATGTGNNTGGTAGGQRNFTR